MAQLDHIRTKFIQGVARIADFWGFPKAMGSAYGAIYLSPKALTLDDLVEIVGVTKGALSTHVTQLERLGLVHRQNQAGDRKDYFSSESDFWGVVRGILREREKREFDRALRTVDDCLEMLEQAKRQKHDAAEVAFCRERMLAMQRFFRGLDRLVASILAIEDFREGALGKLLGLPRTNGSGKSRRKRP